MTKQILTALAITAFVPTLAMAQNTNANTVERLTKVLQNNSSYGKCEITATVGSIKFGSGTYGLAEQPTVEVKIAVPRQGQAPWEVRITIADATSRLRSGHIFNEVTQKSESGTVIEVIDATVLNSDSSEMPNRFIVEHKGDGKVATLKYLKTSTYLDGKGPRYEGNALSGCTREN